MGDTTRAPALAHVASCRRALQVSSEWVSKWTRAAVRWWWSVSRVARWRAPSLRMGAT